MVVTILPSGWKFSLCLNIYLSHTTLHCFEYHHHLIPFWNSKHLHELATVLCTGVGSPWICQSPSLGSSQDWGWQMRDASFIAFVHLPDWPRLSTAQARGWGNPQESWEDLGKLSLGVAGKLNCRRDLLAERRSTAKSESYRNLPLDYG